MTLHNATKLLKNAPSSTGKKYNFERIRALSAQLGNPHKLINYVRLAGSNGKTVCGEMLTDAVKESGYTVGYLSMPLRDDARQNIRIGSEILSINTFTELCAETVAAAAAVRDHARDRLAQLLENPADINESEEILNELSELTPTQNEILLSIALLAFKKEKCDLCIIECEHRGEDPSKFLPPASAVMICGAIPSDSDKEISRIRSYIGRGIGEIVSVPQNAEAFKIISDTCFEAGCRLTVPQRSELSIEKANLRGTSFIYKGLNYELGLCGRFQVFNAIAVIEALSMLERMGFNISHENTSAAFAKLKISSKFEVLSALPFIIADSTHSPIAIETISDSLAEFQSITGEKIYLCLPYGEIADNFISALKKRNYDIKGVVLYSENDVTVANDGMTFVFNTHKAAAKKSLELLERDSLLFISGTHNFTGKIRREILAKLGF